VFGWSKTNIFSSSGVEKSMEATVEALTLGLILYVILPLWVISGSLDYWCHRLSKIEDNSGLRESLLHATMGFLIGIPLWMAIFFEINVLVLLLCFVFFVSHELVAHYDVVWAQSKRRITVGEQHVHAYLLTIPFYLMTLIICRNWGAFMHTITFEWTGNLHLSMRQEPVGTMRFVWWYATLMLVTAILPYTEEVFRCWRARQRRASA
jgi:hypothetical protein